MYLKIISFILIGSICSTLSSPGQPMKYQNFQPKGQEPVRPLPDYVCEADGAFEVPEACELFVQCWAGEAVLWTCTDFYLFDLTYHGCNFPQYTHCEERPRPTDPGYSSTAYPLTSTLPTTTSNVSTTTTEGPDPTYDCPDGDGIFANEERCEYYWRCYAGVAELLHCENDWLFDRRYDGCNFPELTDCDTRPRPIGTNPTTVGTTLTTTLATTTTTDDGGTGETTPEVEPTLGPTGETTEGPVTSAPPPTTTTTRRPGGEFECPTGGEDSDGNYPDPDNCSAFYTCSNGEAFHNYCPIPLYYNIEGDYCDYRNNVDCGTRP